MEAESLGLIIGLSVAVVIGVLLTTVALFGIRYQRKRCHIGNSSSRRVATAPIRANGVDLCTIGPYSTIAPESPVKFARNSMSWWFNGFKMNNVV